MNKENDIGPIEKPVVFFDGLCVLCNGFVNFAFKRDKKQVFYFASLQGKTAQALLPEHCHKRGDSVVYWHEGRCELRSAAVLEIIIKLGGIYKVAIILKLIPRPVRDFVYDWIARHRYRWFGKRDACRQPEPKDQGRMLD